MAAGKLGQSATGLQIRTAVNGHADLLDAVPTQIEEAIEIANSEPIDVERLPEAPLLSYPLGYFVNSGTEEAPIYNVSSAKIREFILSDPDILAYIQAQSNGNANPAAPTNFTVDDDANLAGFTPTSGISDITEYEYQILQEALVGITSNPFSVGNRDIGIGEIGIRVKAASGRNPSGFLYNTVAFTASSTDVPLLPDHFFLPLDHEVVEGREFVENPTHVYASTNNVQNDNPFNTGYKLNPLGEWAVYKSIAGVVGLGEGADGLFEENRIEIGFNDAAQAIYGRRGQERIVMVNQPSATGFVLARPRTGGQIFDIFRVEGITETLEDTIDMGYNLIGTTAIIKGKIGIAPTGKLFYVQAKGAVLNV